MVDKLIALAKDTTIYDQGGEHTLVDEYAGGNVDDAYELGEEDGKTELAREILAQLDIKWYE